MSKAKFRGMEREARSTAAIGHQSGGNPLGRYITGHDGQVFANHRMGMKLFTQAALGRHGSGKHDQAAGIFIQAMDDAQAWQRSLLATALRPRNEARRQ